MIILLKGLPWNRRQKQVQSTYHKLLGQFQGTYEASFQYAPPSRISKSTFPGQSKRHKLGPSQSQVQAQSQEPQARAKVQTQVQAFQ